MAGTGEGQMGRSMAIPPDSTLSVAPAYTPFLLTTGASNGNGEDAGRDPAKAA